MGNKISNAPALLEGRLQDFAQFWGDIDYSDILVFGNHPENWDKAYEWLIKLDKSGFFEADIKDEPTEYAAYNELINLVKQK